MVAIVAILAAIAIPNFLQAQTRAKVVRSLQDMRAVATGIVTYEVDHNSFPIIRSLSSGVNWISDYMRLDGDAQAHMGTPLTTPTAYLSDIPFDFFNSRSRPPSWFAQSDGSKWSFIFSGVPPGARRTLHNQLKQLHGRTSEISM